MDNLRALAMLAGVLFHAGLAYSVVIHKIMPTADKEPTLLADAAIWFSHLFRMPLFFVVAGFFVALLVHKHGVGGMLRNRSLRVALPFVLFWPLLYAAMGGLFGHALDHVENLSPIMATVKQMRAGGNLPSPPPSLMHLWFLPYLMCFCVLVWAVRALEWQWPTRGLASLPIGAFIAVAPLALMLPLLGVPAPFPAPESFFPQWWALLFFGAYFWLGYQLFAQADWIDRLKPHAVAMFIATLVAYVAFFWLLQMQSQIQSPSLTQPKPLLQVAKAALEACAGFWMTLCCLYVGKKWLDRSNTTLRYVSDASYWVYLVHLPILFAIQYRLLDVQASMLTKFLVATFATLLVSLVSYQLLVRHTVLGRLLNGAPKRAQGATTAPA
jgi:glucans biosynthesis protein C